MTASFGPDQFQAAVGASPRAMTDLVHYRALLAEASTRMNLIGPSALDAFWSRHALDCAQLLPHAPDALRWMDVGSGAGLPGVVLAILGRERDGMAVHLVESTQKKANFLRLVVGALELPAEVEAVRAEAVRSPSPDIVTARAVASLSKLLGLVGNRLRGPTFGLFHKGRGLQAELDEALQTWRFDFTVIPSVSDPSGRILKVWNVRRASG